MKPLPALRVRCESCTPDHHPRRGSLPTLRPRPNSWRVAAPDTATTPRRSRCVSASWHVRTTAASIDGAAGALSQARPANVLGVRRPVDQARDHRRMRPRSTRRPRSVERSPGDSATRRDFPEPTRCGSASRSGARPLGSRGLRIEKHHEMVLRRLVATCRRWGRSPSHRRCRRWVAVTEKITTRRSPPCSRCTVLTSTPPPRMRPRASELALDADVLAHERREHRDVRRFDAVAEQLRSEVDRVLPPPPPFTTLGSRVRRGRGPGRSRWARPGAERRPRARRSGVRTSSG